MFTYIIVDLDERSVSGTDEAEVAASFAKSDNFVVITTTSPNFLCRNTEDIYNIESLDLKVSEEEESDHES